jgi:hypothetical protein
MPLEQEINEAIFLKGIVCRVFNGIEKPTEGLGICGRPKGIWLSNTPRGKENVKNEQVRQLGPPVLDLMRSRGTPGKAVG